MYVIYLLLESIIITIISFWIARSPKFCEYFNDFPEKFLVNNKFCKTILINPKYPTTKWFFVLIITQIVLTFITLLLSILYWIGINHLTFLNTYISLIIYLIVFGLCFVPIGIINSFMIKKYIFNKN